MFSDINYDLYVQSAAVAQKNGGNAAYQVLAGIPIMFSTIRSLLIELNDGVMLFEQDEKTLALLANSSNDVETVINKYVVTEDLSTDLRLLMELRNEILHPSLKPAGTPHNTPLSLVPLRSKGVLESRGGDTGDFMWMRQLQSHRLFTWGLRVTEETLSAIMKRHFQIDEYNTGYMIVFRKYRKVPTPTSPRTPTP